MVWVRLRGQDKTQTAGEPIQKWEVPEGWKVILEIVIDSLGSFFVKQDYLSLRMLDIEQEAYSAKILYSNL